MSFFQNLFQSTPSENGKSPLNWIPLTEMSQLKELISTSNSKHVLIFKHSTRCGISRMALNRFENEYDFSDSEIELYFLNLIENRAISNEIESKFKVQHQSPQVIVLFKGAVVYKASHSDIRVSEIKKCMEQNGFS